MIEREGNGASSAETVFTAPVAGVYLMFGKFWVGVCSGPSSAYTRLHIRGVPSGSIYLGSGSPGGSAEQEPQRQYGNQFLEQGQEVEAVVLKDPGITSDADWSYSLSVHLLGGPDLAVESAG